MFAAFIPKFLSYCHFLQDTCIYLFQNFSLMIVIFVLFGVFRSESTRSCLISMLILRDLIKSFHRGWLQNGRISLVGKTLVWDANLNFLHVHIDIATTAKMLQVSLQFAKSTRDISRNLTADPCARSTVVFVCNRFCWIIFQLWPCRFFPLGCENYCGVSCCYLRISKYAWIWDKNETLSAVIAKTATMHS